MEEEWVGVDGTAIARRVLEAVRAQITIVPEPDLAAFGTAIEDMHSDYVLHSKADRMPSVRAVQKTFAELKTAAQQFRTTYASKFGKNWIDFVLLTSVSAEQAGSDLEAIDQELRAVIPTMDKIVGYLNTGLAYCAEEACDGRNARFFQLAQGVAAVWLYGHAIPNLYERFIGREYKIDGRLEDTPQQCFAEALIEGAGFPVTSLSNLRSHAHRQHAARRGLPAVEADPEPEPD